MTFFKGEDRILYIKVSGNWLPVACLTSNPLNEEADMLPTTTRESNGWETSRPTNQRYNIDFDGIQILTGTDAGDTTKVSYDRLKVLKRDRELIEWRISDEDDNFIDEGFGYIQNIGEGNAVGEYLTFSGGIVGFGEPIFTSETGIYLFQDGETQIFQDGTGFLFN